MRLNRSTILNSQTVLNMIQSIVTAIKCSDMTTCSLTRKTQVTCSLALPLISQIQPTRYRHFDLQLFESQGENPEEAVCMSTEKKI